MLHIQEYDAIQNTTLIKAFYNDINITVSDLRQLNNTGVTNIVCDYLAAMETAKRLNTTLNTTLHTDSTVDTWSALVSIV